MQTTTNIGLKTYEAGDPTDWLGEFNYNMNKIDNAVGTQNQSINFIGQTATTAVNTANTASSTASEALQTAGTKASINDTTASSSTTYSSDKIDDLLDAKASINDTTASNTTTYSSNKIDDLILAVEDDVDDKASINDTTASSSTTYSSTKINNLISQINNYSTAQATLVSGNSDYKILHKVDHVVQFTFEWDGLLDGSTTRFNIPEGYRPIEQFRFPVDGRTTLGCYGEIKTNGDIFFGKSGGQTSTISDFCTATITYITSTI